MSELAKGGEPPVLCHLAKACPLRSLTGWRHAWLCVRCRTPVTCLSLGREDFIEAFGNLDEFLQAKTVSTPHH